MTKYMCQRCGTTYDAPTHDGRCPNQVTGCAEALEPLVAIIDREEEAVLEEVVPTPPDPTHPSAGQIKGLCVLVCDASYSMSDPVFPQESPYTKLMLVVNAVQGAITELKDQTRNDTAYIAIVAFGRQAGLISDRQGKPFVKSVREILVEYGNGLATYLHEQFENDRAGIGRDGTNVTAALKLARQVVDGALAGTLAAWGIPKGVRLIEHNDIVKMEGGTINVPNARVLIYSDGEHNQGSLENVFDSMQPVSVLLTAFIGDEAANANTRLGADQMKTLANTCPEHGKKGYFLINSMARRATLRRLYRMASGASGFCPDCLRDLTPSLEAQPSLKAAR